MSQDTIGKDGEDPKSGVIELMHKPSQELKMRGVKTSDGLYKAVLTVCCEATNIQTRMQTWQWHEILGHCSNDVLKATLPHQRDIRESEVDRDNMKCESCMLDK